MPRKPSLRQRFQYFFDNLMSRGTVALIGGLGALSFMLICLAAAVVTIGGRLLAPEGAERITFLEAFWVSMMRTLDPGTMGGDVGWGFRLVMLFVTLGGIFIVSALIGVLTTGVEGKLEELRKGRSLVLESDHTLILGWSPQIFTILSELMIANENQKNARIVILANEDKIYMEDEINARVEKRAGARIVCRSGNPIDLTDLETASPHTARSIIILPPEIDDPDAYVVKTALAITNNPNRRAGKYHIVTQVRHIQNMDVVRMVGEADNLQPVLTGDLIARVVAQTSRQSGLSVVYTELMNFSGDEIYFKKEPVLAGKSFSEALFAYDRSTVIGLRLADGTIKINPPLDIRLSGEDQIIAIAQDDDAIVFSGHSSIPIDMELIRTDRKPRRPEPENALILGWNRYAVTLIRELDHYVARGSRVLLIADTRVSDEAASAEAEIKYHCGKLANLKVTFRDGDTTDRRLLESVRAADYDHVIVLSYAGLDTQNADAKTLVTLLHLRDIAIRDETPFSIISEMLDLRNRQLAEVAHVDDFIVSDHLVSLMIAQLSENAELYGVFTGLFNPEGSEIYLKPVGDYVALGMPVNFYTLLEAARRRGETAIGYRLAADAADAARSYGVYTNPKKSESVIFGEHDKVIVLAEE